MAFPLVHIVDDDELSRKSIQMAVPSKEYEVRLYESAEEFLDEMQVKTDHPQCLVLDLCLPGISGLDLQEELISRGIEIPIIILTGAGNVPRAVKAMRAGAVDFLEKPIRRWELLQQIRRAIIQHEKQLKSLQSEQEFSKRMTYLTPRECEVMELLGQAKSNKQIALELGISLQTVSKHINRVLTKLRVPSILELVKRLERHMHLKTGGV